MTVIAEKSQQTNEARIRAVIDDRVKAIRARDVAGLMSNHAPDIVAFDLLPPLKYAGSDALRERANEWLSSFEDPLHFEVRDLSITAGNDVAFCHCLSGVKGATTAGKEIDMWWRSTMCFRRVDGKWMITHEHSSEPFDMETGKASLNLKP